MQLINLEIKEHAIQELKEDFLSIGITITEKEIAELYKYQLNICTKLAWIECNSSKVELLIQPFMYSPYFPTYHYMSVTKKIIYSFYRLRTLFDYHLSDNHLLEILYQVFYDRAGLQIDSLYTIAKEILVKEGGTYRHERFDTLY